MSVDLVIHVNGGGYGFQNRRGGWVVWRDTLFSIHSFQVICIHYEGKEAIVPIREFGWNVGEIVLDQLMCAVDVRKIGFTVDFFKLLVGKIYGNDILSGHY